MFHFCEIIKRHKAISFFWAMCLLIQGLLIGTITVALKFPEIRRVRYGPCKTERNQSVFNTRKKLFRLPKIGRGKKCKNGEKRGSRGPDDPNTKCSYSNSASFTGQSDALEKETQASGESRHMGWEFFSIFSHGLEILSFFLITSI